MKDQNKYYNKPKGEKEIDKDGCVINRIYEKGECFSAFPFETGWAVPFKAWKIL